MNFEETFNDMTNAMFGIIKEEAPGFKEQLIYIMETNRYKIERITNLLIDGKIDTNEYEGLLKRNMRKIEDQISTLNLMKDKTIQDAVNAGIEVLMKAMSLF